MLHHTERRAPPETEEALRSAGAEVFRYRHAEDLPMHAKFILMDGSGNGDGVARSTYGSFNLNVRSRQVNHELLVVDESPEVFAALDARWRLIEAECRSQAEPS